jgi:hypothetical protein
MTTPWAEWGPLTQRRIGRRYHIRRTVLVMRGCIAAVGHYLEEAQRLLDDGDVEGAWLNLGWAAQNAELIRATRAELADELRLAR